MSGPAKAGSDVAESAGLEGREVLVVEDETIVCIMIEDMPADFGCEIVGPAADLEGALALARDAAVDVAILDLNLNGQRSHAVADLLRERGVPFFFASGYGSEGLGGTDDDAPVLRKPLRTRA